MCHNRASTHFVFALVALSLFLLPLSFVLNVLAPYKQGVESPPTIRCPGFGTPATGQPTTGPTVVHLPSLDIADCGTFFAAVSLFKTAVILVSNFLFNTPFC